MAIKGYWRLNGNLNDASGNGKTLVQEGTVNNISGKINGGKAADWSAANDLYNATALGANLGTQNATVSVLFKKDSAPTALYAPTIISLGVNSNPNGTTGGANHRFYMICGKDNGYLVAASWNGSTNLTTTTNNISICDGKWHHLVMIRNNSQITCFSDSVLVGYVNSANQNILGQNIRFGNNDDPVYDAIRQADYDEVIVDLLAWSPAQIKNEYSRIKGFF